jgi:hypothetical protein
MITTTPFRRRLRLPPQLQLPPRRRSASARPRSRR